MKSIGEPQKLSHAVQLMMAFACLIFASMSSFAQDSQKNAADDQEQITIEPVTITVTVTAQKVTEPALTAPLSVTAVTEEDLTYANINTVKTAVAYAPNTFINEFTSRAVSNPYIRGIGGSPTNPGVSTVIDGVPQLNGFSSNIELVNIDQVEFVRGPQGALHGRNTAGGLINITSRDLTNMWTLQGQGDFGNYSRRDLRASVSSPLFKDHISVDLAAGYSVRDGYTINDFTGHDLDSREAGFGKVQVFLKAADRLQFKLILFGEHDEDGDYALGDLAYIRENPNRVNRDFEGYNRRSIGSATFIADYRGRAINFSSITGGVWWKNRARTDLDYQTATMENFGLFAIRENLETQHQFTQEFRFISSEDRPLYLSDAWKLDWQAGIFVFTQGYRQDAVNDISSTFGFFPPSRSTSFSDLGDSGMGIYGKARFTVWGKMSLAAGLRFDYESKSADLRSSSESSIRPSNSFSEVSPQFSLAYRYSPDHMSYLSIAKGYKAGGFNPAPTGIPAPQGTESYGPEYTWNYELGHKAKWLKDTLETTVAIFYIDWKDLQLNQQIPFGGGQYFIGNAGRANSKGVEFEMRYRPFSWWELFGLVGHTRARFLSGSIAYNSNLGEDQMVGGNVLPYTPTFNTNMGTQVSWAPGRSARLYFRVQLSKYGDFRYDASNAGGQDGYQLVNFRGGIRTKYFFAEGWSDNALNAHYVPIAIPYAQLGAPSGYVGESGVPVTYGARFGVNF
jgi:iron complex outermembrane receptor protein